MQGESIGLIKEAALKPPFFVDDDTLRIEQFKATMSLRMPK